MKQQVLSSRSRFNFFTREWLIQVLSALLILLFFYAATSKLADYDKSRQEMLNQVFPRTVALVLVWLVPLTELMIMTGLFYNATRLKALYASLILLSIFSLYISITMSGVFGRIPCSCGGILQHMGYWTHLIFNLFFIVIAVLCIALEKQWKPINRWFHFSAGKGVHQN